jgi:DnaK suppressor protein
MKKSKSEKASGSVEPVTESKAVTRYSDEDLQEFRKIVVLRLEEARMDYELLRESLSRKDEHGTDDTSPVFKLAEEANDIFSKEEIAQLAIRRQKYIEQLRNALVRIENKTYGICRVTGKLIAKERLRSVPHTTLSIDAKSDAARIH